MIRLLYASIKRKPRNIVFFLLCIFLYLFNEYYIKGHSRGILNYVAICYFNDMLAPVLFLSYTNIILSTNNMELNRLVSIIATCILVGLFWEYGAMYLKSDSVADIYDLVAYITGGIVYWTLNEVFQY